MITKQQILDRLAAAHNPALADVEGHLYQVWQDGEQTLTKCGSLLGFRKLHMIRYGMAHEELQKAALEVMPPANSLGNSSVYCTMEDADWLTAAMNGWKPEHG